MKKNMSGQSVSFQMLSTTDGSSVTSGTPTVYIVGDGGTQATGSGTSTHKGNGLWQYSPTQAETNYDHVVFTMVLTSALSQTVNVYTDYPQTGDSYGAVGSLNNISSDDVNAACDTALSDYDPPTNAEMLDAFAALNDISSADVNAACYTALSDYDPPTNTEMSDAFAALNDPTLAEIADAVLDEVLTDLSDNGVNPGQSITTRKALRAVFNRFFREVTQTASLQVVKNDASVQISEMAISDDGTTQTKGTSS